MVINVIDFWQFLTAIVAPYSPFLILVIACFPVVAAGGVSVLFAVGFDAISLVTLHIKMLYHLFCHLHVAQLGTMSTFVKLLRGRKKNVFRKRVDHVDYDEAQLL